MKADVADWQSNGKMQRLWQRDASLWTGDDEAKWLGWLDITEEQIAHLAELQNLAKEVRSAGFKDVLLLGMGGSSLCPEVLRMTFGKINGFPICMFSTRPILPRSRHSKIKLISPKTLFIVSSKSGSTLEPNIFKQYFFEQAKKVVGADKAGSHFIAITDPGSKMQQVAEARSVSSYLLWAAYHRRTVFGAFEFRHGAGRGDGSDTKKFLDRTEEMVRACGASVPVEKILAPCLGSFWDSAAERARQSHDHHFSGISRIWARGWSNCWRSPRENLGKASSQWIVKRLARRSFMVTTGCLLICIPKRTGCSSRMRRSRRWKRLGILLCGLRWLDNV